MGEMSVEEVRRLLVRLEEELARRGEIVVTRQGRPVARILPVTSARATGERRSHADLRRRMKKARVTSAEVLRKEREAR